MDTMKRSVIRVLDELVNLIVLVIVLILGGYGVYTLWDDRKIYQRADMENYETWRPEEMMIFRSGNCRRSIRK